MSRTSSAVTVLIIIVLAVGGYAIFHKSNKPTQVSSHTSQSAPAVNNAVLVTKTDPSLGQYLADLSGRALYTYNADTKDVSNCTGSCLTTWPAYVDKGTATNLPAGVSTIKRSDNGQTQYTYNGMPLYYFASDSAGQVTGNGVDNFSVAKPAAASSSSGSGSNSAPAPSSSSTPSSNYSSPSYSY